MILEANAAVLARDVPVSDQRATLPEAATCDVSEHPLTLNTPQVQALLHAAAGYAIIGTDASGTITFFSTGAEQMLGYQAQEVDGRHTLELFHDPDEIMDRASRLGIPPGFSVLTQVARRGPAEWTYIRKDGQRLTVELTVTPVRDDDGAISGFVGITRDVTPERALERQKDEFLANVSHDLRTPISAIKASVGVVLVNEPSDMPEPLHRLLLNADLAADHMAALVDDLLELTRLRAGRARFEPDYCDLRTVVLRSVAEIEALALERGQRMRVSLPPTEVPAVVDARRLERALLNVLGNAQKYGRTGGTISVQLAGFLDEVVISVTDDGPGIPAAEQEQIFERFYRANGAATAGRPGIGLGLPIARALVALHGGRIWVESKPGAGATFRIALPITSQSERQAE